MIALFPWAARFRSEGSDLTARTDRPARPGRSGGSRAAPYPAVSARPAVPELPVLPLAPRPPEVVLAAVRAVRDEWDWQPPEITHFYVFQRGGEWTEAHIGVASDAVRALPRGPIARPWCQAYGWPENPTWSKREHTVRGANEMAREMCRRAQHFFNIYLNADDDEFEYTAADLASYPGNLEFVTWASEIDLHSRTWTRIQDILRTFPVSGVGAEDS